jgi:propionate CoA-transferase
MEEALTRRGVAPHVFERKEDAHAFLDGAGKIRRASTAIASAA